MKLCLFFSSLQWQWNSFLIWFNMDLFLVWVPFRIAISKLKTILIKDLIYLHVYHCRLLTKVGKQSCFSVALRLHIGLQAKHVSFRVESLTYLIYPVHEVHRDTEGQRMMIRISKKGWKNFHSWRSCFAISILLRSFYTSLAINGIFSKLCSIIQNLR